MPWWDGAVGYEVYLRSFADTDGDGYGDLPGITSRLDHLESLGVDILWVTPCYPSPGADHGYDVSDYLDVAMEYGGLAALDELLDAAHDRGMRVMLDIVPNHSSDQHRWFREALADPSSPRRSYYIWRDGRGGGAAPPNNWISHFGGPAWTRDPASGQWYLHLFLPEQPDLNWDNPAVRDEFDHILTTWFERGVDGFRIDVAHALVKAPGLPDNDWPDPLPDTTNPVELFMGLDHEHDLDQADVTTIYERWHEIAAAHDAHLVGEVYLLDAERLSRYVADGRLHRSFYFPALRTGWDADEIRRMVRSGVEHGGGRFAWPMSSHDDARAATRFGGGSAGRRRQEAFFALLAGLPGTPYLYQGDEFGLEDGVLPVGAAQDPLQINNPGAVGRDGSRTPIVWDNRPGRGFTTGEPWMPFGTNHGSATSAATQAANPDSTLVHTISLLRTRRNLSGMLTTDDVTWLGRDSLVAFRRGDIVIACNIGQHPADLDVDPGAIVHSTDPAAVVSSGTLRVPGDATVWLQLVTP